MTPADVTKTERELYVLVPPYGSDEASLLRQLARTLWARRWIVLACVLLGAAAGLTTYSFRSRIYVVSATLAPAPTDESSGALAALGSQLGGLAALAGISVGDGAQSKDEALAILQSRTFTYSFLKENDLLPVLFRDEWDPEANAWKVARGDEPTLGDAWELFNERIRTVREDRRTGLVTLSIAWTDPAAAARWISDLVLRLNEFMRHRTIEEAETSLGYLNREIEKTTSVEVEQAIYRLIETQVKKVMLANVRAEYAMRVIDPPIVPEADEFDRPKLLASLVVGAFAGLFLGVLVAAWLSSRRSKTASREGEAAAVPEHG